MKEYRYHKQAWKYIINTANWIRYPAHSILTFDEAHPCELPPTIMSHIKWQRLI